MADFDASTPQLQTVKKWIDSFISLDISKADLLISRNFKFQSFPKSTELPEQPTKEAYIQWFGRVFALLATFSVRIHRRRTTRKLISIPRPSFTN
jgi:hypothetical protein